MEFERVAAMKIRKIKENKKQFLSLLLLADEQENMIDRYLERGTMYVLDDNGVKAECVVADEGDGILEIKNIATVPEYQGKGYAKALIDFIVKEYADKYSVLQVGTGDSPLTVPFYEKWFVVLRAVRRGISRTNRDTGNTFWAKLTTIAITAMDSRIRTYTISEA